MTDTNLSTALQPQHTSLPQQYTATPAINYIPQTSSGRFFTEDEVERIRQQEKDKMYDRLEKSEKQLAEFKSTVDSLAQDKKSRDAELARQQQQAAEETQRLQNEKLSVQEMLEQQKTEFQKQQEMLKADWDLKLTTMQKEQEFLQLRAYIQKRINEEVNAATIIPDLAEYINGDTEEEVEASIKKAQEKTESIVQAALGSTPPSIPMGTSPTGAPFSPLDNLSGPRQKSREEIARMNMRDYAEYRRQTGLDRAGSGQGLFS